MRYVLDSCVAFKWEITEPLSDKARKLRDEARNGIHLLLAPDVFPIELGHAMTRADLAERTNCALITSDDKLIRILQPHFPFIIRLLSLP